MKCLKKSIAALFLLTAVTAFSGTVNYTATSATNPADISDPVNWDGTVDETADLVISKSVLDGKSVTHLTLGGSISAHSLTLTGFSAVERFINPSSSSHSITLGEGGLSSDVLMFHPNCRVTTTASQTWYVRGLVTHYAISGVADQTLTISQENAEKSANIIHRVSPQYAGTLVYSKIYKDSNIWACGNDKWAQNVTCEQGLVDYKVFICPNARVRWRTLIPGSYTFGRNFYLNDWKKDNGGDETKLGQGMIVIDDNVGTLTSRNPFNMMGAGFEIADGGTFRFTQAIFGLGQFWSGGDLNTPTAFAVTGGSATIDKGLWIGLVSRDNYSDTVNGDKVVTISDGTVTVGEGARVGGAETAYVKNNAVSLQNPAPYCALNVEGGALNLSSTAGAAAYKTASHGLSIDSYECKINNYSNAEELPTAPGMYVQTGGVVTAARVMFGSTGSYNSGVTPALGDGFGVFDLRGGTFNLGNATAGCLGFDLGYNWNSPVSTNLATGAVTEDAVGYESSYKIALGGGKLVVENGDVRNELSVVVPNHGEAFELNTTKIFSQNAPLWGHGTLKKTGAGTVFLTDACRFEGSLDVREGMLAVLSEDFGAEPETSDCVVWRADDLVQAGKADGASIDSWWDGAHTYEATEDDSESEFTAHKLPLLRTNRMNGHAALEFWRSENKSTNAALIVKSNPVKGCTNFTVAVVLNPPTGVSGNGDGVSWNGILYSKTILGTIVGNNCFALQHPGNIQNRFVMAASYVGGAGSQWVTAGETDGYRFVNDRPCVLIATLSGNKMSFSMDGHYEELTVTSDAANYPRHLNSDKAFGICRSMVDNGQQRGFVGDIAEIRIYRDRALTRCEHNALCASLMRTYANDRVRDEDVFVQCTASGAGGYAYNFTAEAPVATGPTPDVKWTAGDIVSLAGGAADAPTEVENVLNGKAVARFDGTQKVTVPAASSPFSNVGSFTAVVVFRTTAETEDAKVFDSGLGLLSTKQATSEKDLHLSLKRHGAIAGAVGESDSNNRHNFEYKPCGLNDGEAHVVVFGYEQAAASVNLIHMMTDGRYQSKVLGTTAQPARGSFDLLIGARKATEGFFAGDIAEIQVFKSILSTNDMMKVSAKAAQDYAFQLLGKGKYDVSKLAGRGLGAKEISVAADAMLILPRSSSAPLTLTSGRTLTGAGTVSGTVKLGSGGVLDATVVAFSKIDNLVLAGGTVAFDAENPQILSVGDLDITVGGTLSVKGTLASNVAFISYDTLTGDLSNLTAVSETGGELKVINDSANRQLIIKPRMGLMLIVR